jgi:hypothetical protein
MNAHVASGENDLKVENVKNSLKIIFRAVRFFLRNSQFIVASIFIDEHKIQVKTRLCL